MAEYSYDNIIVNPFKEGIESLIGKEVYFHVSPYLCLKNANEKSPVNLGTLVEVRKDRDYPFVVKRNGADVLLEFPVIIEKKEEPKPEYIPFTNQEEFLNHYASHKDRLVEGSSTRQLSSLGGVWLKDKYLTSFHMVTEIWDDGVIIGDTKMKTVKSGKGEYFTMNDITKWCELLEDYTFLDGAPCGREEEPGKIGSIIAWAEMPEPY